MGDSMLRGRQVLEAAASQNYIFEIILLLPSINPSYKCVFKPATYLSISRFKFLFLAASAL